MTGVAWTTIENAIAAWAIAGTGLTKDALCWAGDNSPRPGKPFVMISLTVGPPLAIEELKKSDNGGASPNDLNFARSTLRPLHVTFQAFSDAAHGATSPWALLEGIAARRSLQSHIDAMKAADIGILDVGGIKRVDGVINSTTFEPRAILEVRCIVTSEIVETGGYFDTFRITNQIPDPDDTFDVT